MMDKEAFAHAAREASINAGQPLTPSDLDQAYEGYLNALNCGLIASKPPISVSEIEGETRILIGYQA